MMDPFENELTPWIADEIVENVLLDVRVTIFQELDSEIE